MIIPLPQEEEREGFLVEEPFSKVGPWRCTGLLEWSSGASCSLKVPPGWSKSSHTCHSLNAPSLKDQTESVSLSTV